MCPKIAYSTSIVHSNLNYCVVYNLHSTMCTLALYLSSIFWPQKSPRFADHQRRTGQPAEWCIVVEESLERYRGSVSPWRGEHILWYY